MALHLLSVLTAWGEIPGLTAQKCFLIKPLIISLDREGGNAFWLGVQDLSWARQTKVWTPTKKLGIMNWELRIKHDK